MYIDTHTHLLNEELKSNKDKIAESLLANDIECIIEAGCDFERGKGAIELIDKHKNVYAALGMHPHDAKDFTPEYEKWLISNLKHPKVVAVGEIGLDYHYMYSTREQQIKVLTRQLEIAYQAKLPVVIHSRDAEADMCEVLLKNAKLLQYGLLIHCFTGTLEFVNKIACLKPVYSFGGVVTFKKTDFSERVNRIGLENIVLETDCPYLSPEPFRGKINVPESVKIVSAKLALMLGIQESEVAKATTKNAKKFFDI